MGVSFVATGLIVDHRTHDKLLDILIGGCRGRRLAFRGAGRYRRQSQDEALSFARAGQLERTAIPYLLLR